jgi:hypothetical protein
MIDTLQFDSPSQISDLARLNVSDWNKVSGKVFGDFLRDCRERDVRTMAQFAEQEVVIPTGPFALQRYSLQTQPYARLWFNEIDSGRWYEHCGTGPSQSGKSLSFFVIPIIYHLFERGETVIMATTTDDMFRDKFHEDVMPVIEKSRFKNLVPAVGKNAKEVYFKNGSRLKNMTCGGNDKARSHYTASVLSMTEVDGMSQGHSTSSESHPIAQLEARLRSEQRSARSVYKECTVTFEDGYIWHSVHERGSGGMIFCRCLHCKDFVRLERNHLIGWENAKDEIDAEEMSFFHCYKCGQAWSEEDRIAANLSAVLVHKTQKIENGKVVGPLPRTRTLGFRYSAVNNLLLPAADVGVDEFNAKQSDDEIAEEKRMTQFVWCMPFVMPGEETIKLDQKQLNQRRYETTKGLCPAHVKYLTIGADVGLYDFHWVAIAWVVSDEQRYGVVIDYGKVHLRIENPTYDPDAPKSKQYLNANDLSFEEVWNVNIDRWRKDVILRGFPIEGSEVSERMFPDQVWIDSRYQGRDGSEVKPVYDWIREKNKDHKGLIRPLLGFGVQQYSKQHRRYNAPKKVDGKTVLKIGQNYHMQWNDEQAIREIHTDSNKWLEVSHARLNKPKEQNGALMMYESSNPAEHNRFMAHVVATVKKRHFEPGKGWEEEEAPKRQDHYGDALGYCSAAGHYAGFRIHPSRKKVESTQQKKARRKRQRKAGKRYEQPANIPWRS